MEVDKFTIYSLAGCKPCVSVIKFAENKFSKENYEVVKLNDDNVQTILDKYKCKTVPFIVHKEDVYRGPEVPMFLMRHKINRS